MPHQYAFDAHRHPRRPNPGHPPPHLHLPPRLTLPGPSSHLHPKSPPLARAPGLQEQLERALAGGVPYLILDGKVVDTDRCRENTVSRKGETIDLRYPGKALVLVLFEHKMIT